MTREESKKILDDLVKLLEEKEGIDIKVINMEKSSLMVDFFVIVTGNSDTHMSAMRDYVVQFLKDEGVRPNSYDKGRGFDWMAVDSGNIIVHILSEKGRRFYDLESLWREYAAK
ncbi:MAG: ribosome silencing factor [Thermotogae bacterium]|nr:ribosome silencing factor [Thermotogota bacterium]MCP5465454.1 ribosome silencing factor [Thermotogota bacterium]HOO74775.1 ribosome silencing factor [Tepiditoga sp.]